MKIRYVKSLIFIFCIAIMPSSRGTGNTLAQVLGLYPNVKFTSLEFPGETTLVSGDALIEKLASLTTLPEEWVKSIYGERTPLELIGSHIYWQSFSPEAHKLTSDQMKFLYAMVEKLLASGEKRDLTFFKDHAYDPQFCLAFLKNLKKDDPFLQENEESVSAIEIVINEICRSRTKESEEPIPPAYEEVLKEILKQPGYQVTPRTLTYIADRTDCGSLVAKLLAFVLEHGGKPAAEFEQQLEVIKPNKELKSRIGVELIKLSFKSLLVDNEGDLVINPPSAQPGLVVENIKKYVTNFGADLATQVSLSPLKVRKSDVGAWKQQSLYYYLMVYLASAFVDKEHTNALCLVCNEWLEKQEEDVRKKIIDEKNLQPKKVDLKTSAELVPQAVAPQAAAPREVMPRAVTPIQEDPEPTLPPDTATSKPQTTTSTLNASHTRKSELLSPRVKNALIGVVVVTSLAGLFYGARHVMKKNGPFEPMHHDEESGNKGCLDN